MNARKSELPKFMQAFVEASGYRGRKFSIEFVERFTVPTDAGLWGGGTCEKFYVIDRNGSTASALNNASPWRECGRGAVVEIPRDVVLACRSWFCGKDCGFTFYVNPSKAGGRFSMPQAVALS